MRKQILTELKKVKRKNFPSFIMWLEETDFFSAPCSKDHHANFEGGLAWHSWNVFKLFKEKNEKYNLGLSNESVIICGLLHDICKVNFYALRKDGYEYDDKFPCGHGEKSVIVLLKHIPLTEQECCIIRWHMAGFDISPYGKQAYYNAVNMYPACLALHTADYEATTFLEASADSHSYNSGFKKEPQIDNKKR